jgi:hypothetical protein
MTADRTECDESQKRGLVKVDSHPLNVFRLYGMAGNHFESSMDRFGDYASDS